MTGTLQQISWSNRILRWLMQLYALHLSTSSGVRKQQQPHYLINVHQYAVTLQILQQQHC